jgi:hypothetical protein
MTKHLTLTEEETATLQLIARRTGKSPDELIHEAIAEFLTRSRQAQRTELLRNARGMWRDRTDIPALETLRGEFDRLPGG